MAAPETIDGSDTGPRRSTSRHIAEACDDIPIGVVSLGDAGGGDAWLPRSHATVAFPCRGPGASIQLCDGFPVYPRLAVAIERLAERLTGVAHERGR